MYSMNIFEIDNYNDAVSYIDAIPRFSGKSSMEKTIGFRIELLSRDELNTGDGYDPVVIHVAGTNGKGSVCAFLTSMHGVMGRSTGTFTSPHLVRTNERIVIDGKQISDEEFLEYFYLIRKALEEGGHVTRDGEINYHPSYFEFLFFIALCAFTIHRVDVQIWETGLGGRLDATNSLRHKSICVITEIGFDHMEYLGDTIEAIAAEKAGIIRPHIPVVTVEGTACRVIRETASACNAPCTVVSNMDNITIHKADKGIDFSYNSRYYKNVSFMLATNAFYQAENASIALMTMEQLYSREEISVDMMREGLLRMRWPGRMEEVQPGVFYDGAHNVDGVRAFLLSVREDGCSGRRFLLFSAVNDKQADIMIKDIVESSLFATIATAHIDSYRGMDIEELRRYLSIHDDARVYDSVEEGLHAVMSEKSDKDYVYVCGSLYMIGELKSHTSGEN